MKRNEAKLLTVSVCRPLSGKQKKQSFFAFSACPVGPEDRTGATLQGIIFFIYLGLPYFSAHILYSVIHRVVYLSKFCDAYHVEYFFEMIRKSRDADLLIISFGLSTAMPPLLM